MEENRYWWQISQKPHPIRKVSHTILHGLIWFVHFSPQLCFVLFGRFPLSSTPAFPCYLPNNIITNYTQRKNNNNKINKQQLSVLRHHYSIISKQHWYSAPPSGLLIFTLMVLFYHHAFVHVHCLLTRS